MIEVAIILALITPALLFGYFAFQLKDKHAEMKMLFSAVALFFLIGTVFTGFVFADTGPATTVNVDVNNTETNNILKDRLPQTSSERLDVETTSSTGQAVVDGELFAYGEELSVSSGSTGSWHVENPSDSCTTLQVLSVDLSADTHVPVDFRKNADSTASGTGNSVVNLNFGSSNSANATVKTGTDAVTGGSTFASPEVDPSDRYRFEGLVVVPPGNNITAVWQAGGIASSTSPSLSFQWREIYQPSLPGCS